MSRQQGEAPRQDSAAFAANDAVAQQQGAGRSTAPQSACPALWTLRVDVSATADARRTRLGDARVQLAWADGTQDDRGTAEVDALHARGTPLRGRGAARARCSASATGWYAEQPIDVTLADGDDRAVEVPLKPLPWVELRVREMPADRPLGLVQVRARVPELPGEHTVPVPDTGLLVLEMATLRPGMHLELLELSHPDVVWEVAADLESA